jgi:hypothetical protein
MHFSEFKLSNDTSEYHKSIYVIPAYLGGGGLLYEDMG